MSRRSLAVLVLAILPHCSVRAQSAAADSTTRNPISIRNFTFDLAGGLLYQGSPYLEVEMPDYQRREVGISSEPFHAGDETLFHGTSYLDFGTHFHYAAFTLDAHLIAEHRGQSYGVYALRAIDVYPKYLAALDTGGAVLGQNLGLHVSMGNYDDLRLQEGLMFYNLDAQGSRFRISIDRFSVIYQKLADLTYGIGLNQGDGNVFSARFDSLPLPMETGITGEYAISIPTGVRPTFSWKLGRYLPPEANASQTFSLRFSHSSGVAAYGEFGLRNTSLPDNTALLAGLSYETSNKFFSLKTHAEYRSYGAGFNLGFYDPPLSYFDTNGVKHIYAPQRYELGSRFLYPIQVYERPFSQWAVFTEYQGLNVSGLTFFADLRVPIAYGIFFKGLLDWNRITAEGEQAFIYPFYSVGLGWQPFEGVSALYSYTNRTMNLSMPYPTLWLYRAPTAEAIVRWDLRF